MNSDSATETPSPSLVRRIRDSLDFHLLSFISRKWERRFRVAPPERYMKQLSSHVLAGVRVFCLCGERQGHEEILSILSFLRHVGIPESWTVVSDGSISAGATARFRGLHPAVRVAAWEDFFTPQNRACVELYAPISVWGKKLAVLTAMPPDGVSLYIDSDILFFPGAVHLRELLQRRDGNYFMEDYGFGMFAELLSEEEKRLTILNAGFLVQTRPIDWQGPMARLLRYIQAHDDFALSPTGPLFAEQTVTHLAYHASGARPLPRDRYVMDLEDAYRVKDFRLTPQTVLRHYFNRSRMKFWPHARDYLR